MGCLYPRPISPPVNPRALSIALAVVGALLAAPLTTLGPQLPIPLAHPGFVGARHAVPGADTWRDRATYCISDVRFLVSPCGYSFSLFSATYAEICLASCVTLSEQLAECEESGASFEHVPAATKPASERERREWLRERQGCSPGTACRAPTRNLSGPEGPRFHHRSESKRVFSCQRTVRLSPGERTKNIRRYHVVRLSGRASTGRSFSGRATCTFRAFAFRATARQARLALHRTAVLHLRSRFFFSGCHFRLSLWRGSCFVMRRGSRPGSRRGALFFSRCVKRMGVPMKSKASRRRFSRNR